MIAFLVAVSPIAILVGLVLIVVRLIYPFCIGLQDGGWDSYEGDHYEGVADYFYKLGRARGTYTRNLRNKRAEERRG